MVKWKILFVVLLSFFCSFNSFCQNNKSKEYNRKATFYHNKFVNRKTSTGDVFSQDKYTAAHRTIALNTLVRVTNKKNGKWVIVNVNDRCPRKGVIDLSLVAAKRLDMIKDGVASVKIEILDSTYTNLWKRQDEIFEMFNFSPQNDTLDVIIFDSIMTKLKVKN